MKTQMLTLSDLLKAKIGGVLNSTFFAIPVPNKNTPGYEFDSYASASSSRKAGFVAYYIKDGKKVFIKKHQYKFKDMDYLYIHNEASLLEMLKSHLGFKFKSKSGITVNIGNFLGSEDTGSSIYVATSFEEGIMLEHLPQDEKIIALQSCLEVVGELYEQLPHHIKEEMPKRGSLSFLFSFFLLALKSSLKDPNHVPLFMSCLYMFYYNFLSSLSARSPMSLVHRDLSKENILYDKKNKTATIVDWENAVVTDSLYDIATLPWLYSKWISEEKLIPFLLQNLGTIQSRRRFVALALYHVIQCISIYDKKSIHYRDVLAHTIKFKNKTARLILAAMHRYEKNQ